ncbi:MAG: UDP-N-acetylglucosamine 1-carboxyvinyltransferase [Defluviitaleaceae bacterium]|nr:UDP-N-acetylglucosamine 1-carboxyvinyltransferase [Defluviitaleaceae bacterium]
MLQYRVQGMSTGLFGDVRVGGAKNSVLPILAAVCLNDGESVIHNCPRIADTFVSMEILQKIGCVPKLLGDTLVVNTKGLAATAVPDDCVRKMRSSILFMGAMLARAGQVELTLPGGCELGTRAIDLHLMGLSAMGADIKIDGDKICCKAGRLVGANIKLHTASVGATENIMIAAVKAHGETVIENAACEPEIVDLADFLIGMGAKIHGAGTSRVVISGVNRLYNPVPHVIMPDRIVAGTYLVAAAMTGGDITVTDVNPTDLLPVLAKLIEMGCRIKVSDGNISLRAPKRLAACPRIITKVHPGFPTDMQAQFVAALAVAEGKSLVTETVFDKRHQHAAELNRMGAKISLCTDNRNFTIQGVENLRGATVAAKDLRGGAALVLAGLVAKGETVVQNAGYIQRGYESIERDLESLGAKISLEGAEQEEKCA